MDAATRRPTHQPPTSPGALELLTVQTGTIRLEVGDCDVEVAAGDSAWFDATHPHHTPTTTREPAAASFTPVVLEPA